MSADSLSVAVVIPTKDRPEALRLALRSLSLQSQRPQQIVVVDSSGIADRPEELSAAANLDESRLIYCWVPESRGLTASRNVGIGRCSADIIQFMDDDTTLSPDFLKIITAAFADRSVGGICGQMVDPTAPSIPLKRWLLRAFYTGPFRQRKEELFLDPPSVTTDCNTLPGASAYRSAVFDRHRYDERIVNMIGEDVDFSFRVAREWRLVIMPGALITHTPWPANRPSSRAQYADKIGFFHYHFRKNMTGTLAEWFAFVWMNVGIAIDASLRGGADGIGGVIHGWRRIAGSQRGRKTAAHAAIDDGGIGR